MQYKKDDNRAAIYEALKAYIGSDAVVSVKSNSSRKSYVVAIDRKAYSENGTQIQKSLSEAGYYCHKMGKRSRNRNRFTPKRRDTCYAKSRIYPIRKVCFKVVPVGAPNAPVGADEFGNPGGNGEK